MFNVTLSNYCHNTYLCEVQREMKNAENYKEMRAEGTIYILRGSGGGFTPLKFQHIS